MAGNALAAGGGVAALIAFSASAITITILMFTLSLGIATAKSRLIASFRMNTSRVKRWGGQLMMLVGAWLILLGLFAGPS